MVFVIIKESVYILMKEGFGKIFYLIFFSFFIKFDIIIYFLY